MTTIQTGITALLKSAITGVPQQLPAGFDIQTAAPLIQRHHMVSMAYIGALTCGIPQQDPLMQQFFRSYCKVLQISERQMQALERVFAAFEKNGIDYMPLKGTNMKQLYPKPELRIMGDADVLIQMEQYEKIIPIMESLGFTPKMESDHELSWQSADLYLELHKRLIPSYNEEYYAYYGDGWEFARLQSGSRFAMTPEDSFVYLFTHFTKHYRDGGIGCRHVVDLWVYLRSYLNLDEAYIQRELEKLKLLEFYQNMRRLITVWFEGAAADDKTDFMTEFIFASGSWGAMDSGAISMGLRNAKRGGSFGSKLIYVWRHLFPGVALLKYKYTVLQKVPWLLPVVWVIRPFYKVFAEWGSVMQHKRKLDLMSQENIDERRQMLQYVGLEFQ